MKRDMDLVRSILIAIEENEKALVSRGAFDRTFQQMFPDDLPWTNNQIIEHVRIMGQAGLTEASMVLGPRGFSGISITWDGHEFIASARNENVWQKAKSMFGDASFDVFKQGLVNIATEVLTSSGT